MTGDPGPAVLESRPPFGDGELATTDLRTVA